jgi:alkanesulfonate monooxygenase SsuD/methylene tetrahydromethanopterin reductase-like flavin-dependent oxidoreductase (luciferase family)
VHPIPRFGTVLPTRELTITGSHDPAPLFDIARELDGMVDSLWIGESIVARPRMDAYALLAAVAAYTSQAEIGSAVILPSLRNPLAFAHAVATIDVIARGRLVLGVGSGFPGPDTEAEFSQLGADYARRITGVEAVVDAAKAIWRASTAGETATDPTGRFGFSDVALAPPPSRPDGPQTWLATASPAGLARCGRHHDGWLPYSPTPGQFGDGLRAVRGAAAAAGREPSSVTAGLYVTVAIGKGDEPRERLESYCNAYYGLPAGVVGALQALVAGPVEAVAARLAEYLDAGAEHIVIRHATLDVAAVPSEAIRLYQALHAVVPGSVTDGGARPDAL